MMQYQLEDTNLGTLKEGQRDVAVADDPQPDVGKGAVMMIVGCVFVVILCLTLPWIIADLIFANQINCSILPVPGFSFTLSTWLSVDAYTRIGILGLFFLIMVIACFNPVAALLVFGCSTIILAIYSLFQFAWLIVGAVMFWGNLNKTGFCDQGITVYMYILLISSFIGIFINMLNSRRNRQQQ